MIKWSSTFNFKSMTNLLYSVHFMTGVIFDHTNIQSRPLTFDHHLISPMLCIDFH